MMVCKQVFHVFIYKLFVLFFFYNSFTFTTESIDILMYKTDTCCASTFLIINSVLLSVILLLFFMLYKAPVCIIKKLEGIRRKFFWGGSDESKKISWIRWGQVLNKEEFGGLNIGSLNALNLGLLAKWWWRYHTEGEALWRKTIKALHGEDGNLGGRSRNGCWGSIGKINKMLNLGNIDLRHLFFETEDGWGWGLEEDAVFSVASIRRLINDQNLVRSDVQTPGFKQCPRKANILLWRVAMDRLPTRDNLLKRGMHIPSLLCPLCNMSQESAAHLFFLCPTTVQVRKLLLAWFPMLGANASSVTGLINDLARLNGVKRKMAHTIHLSVLWVVWGYRNDLVHLAKRKCAAEICSVIKNVAYNWFRSKVYLHRTIEWEKWNVNPITSCNPC